MSCISCGFKIITRKPWLAKYRVVYKTSRGAHLSDVVTYSDERHKDYSYHYEEGGTMELARDKYLIHELCWSRLLAHFDQISLDRLFEVFKYMPSAMYTERLETLRYVNPDQLPSVTTCREVKEEFPTPSQAICDSMNIISPYDCFALLPLELRVEIAAHLSTMDYLGLRYCSRAMAAVFNNEAFWKTRFLVHRERGFFAYLADNQPNGLSSTGWRLIYHRTNRVNRYNPAWKAMRRQWKTNTWFQDRYSMARAPDISHQMRSKKRLHWETAQRHQCRSNGKCCGDCNFCRHLFSINEFTQSIRISSVVKIIVSILHEAEKTFITGLELIQKDSTTPVAIGYQTSRQETIDLQAHQLRGFIVNTGPRGIHALRPVTNKKLDWVGRLEDTGNVELLSTRIKVIAGTFDVST
ncbi:hypothetical protein ASPZODRAFT_167768 [Penicilliopsis zonata CBS 506.65]|uniref:F-box domain-containing protein n=1 Tax=Penicilliopsis zonata CBS 506.65 TaxID=1073090 RepID=A0A1L9SDQ6_9EURO|nr:hypothetical protein ASPZODRAFT_167768 [Penicilliopsis zonata CBS 506.65]OJJ45309.1 hypothetical protein ASPZODRAFT_167768 [Penicilliopsis zonata CBS 506.65]